MSCDWYLVETEQCLWLPFITEYIYCAIGYYMPSPVLYIFTFIILFNPRETLVQRN